MNVIIACHWLIDAPCCNILFGTSFPTCFALHEECFKLDTYYCLVPSPTTRRVMTMYIIRTVGNASLEREISYLSIIYSVYIHKRQTHTFS